jgi:hypothetical protein
MREHGIVQADDGVSTDPFSYGPNNILLNVYCIA